MGVFGLRGECKIDATRLGADSLSAGALVHVLLPDGTERDLRLQTVRQHKGRPLARFEGYDDANAAQTLVGATLALDRAAVVLAPGEFLDADLVGCQLTDAAGKDLGAVVGVEHFPAQDMLVVGTARTLVPLVSAFVTSVDVGAKRIVVDLPPGLLDDREADVG